MRFNKILLLLLLPILLLPIIIIMHPHRPSIQNNKQIGVFLWARHPIIEEIYNGFRSRLQSEADARNINISFSVKYADGDMLQANTIASYFKTSSIDALLTVGLSASQAAKSAGITQPIILGGPPDAVSTGLVGRLKDHGTNMAGTVYFPPINIILDTLISCSPGAKLIAVMHNPGEQNSMAVVKQLEKEALGHSLNVRLLPVSNAIEIDASLRTLKLLNVDALFIPTDNLLYTNLEHVVNTTNALGIPVISCTRLAVEKGAVFSVATDYDKVGEMTAETIFPIIFDGVPPSSLDIRELNEGAIYVDANHQWSNIIQGTSDYKIIKIKAK